MIYEIKAKRKMLTVCSELALNIWGFEHGKSHTYRQIMLHRNLADIKINNCLIFMGFRTGDTEIFHWQEDEKELYRLAQDKMDEHEEELASIDMLQSRGLFVTGGRDGLVKVWNIKKQLVREIKFPEPITSVAFLNPEGDILVGHIGKVSSVMAVDYKPFEVRDLS
jgi:WD40 repeat protein